MNWQKVCDFISKTVVVEKIDSRDVVAIKTHSKIWSRRELRNACETLCRCSVPQGKRKSEYAKMLVALRALRRLEQNFIERTSKRCKNDTCCICKELLQAPIFRYKDQGYHLECIHQWISVSHKFRDPIFGESYRDEDLKRIDVLTQAYDLDLVNLYRLHNDMDRKEEDAQMEQQEEQLEIFTDLLERDVEALAHAFRLGNAHIIEIISDHFENFLHEASHVDGDFVRNNLVEFTHRIAETGNEPFLNYILELLENCDNWADEDDDADRSLRTFLSHNPFDFMLQHLASHHVHNPIIPLLVPPNLSSSIPVLAEALE